MIIWIDAQLSPALASWITENFKIQAHAVHDLGLLEAEDQEIYEAARKARAVIMTKDSDFITLVHRHSSPPRVIWVTCGNTSNIYLKKILKESFHIILGLLEAGESIVEVSDSHS